MLPPTICRQLDRKRLGKYNDLKNNMNHEQTTTAEPIKVLIADPYQLFRQALRSCLEETPNVQVVGEVKSPSEYRKAQATIDHQIAIIASDLLEGSHSAVPLTSGDMRITDEEAIGNGDGAARPMVVLVADEDLGGLALPPISDR